MRSITATTAISPPPPPNMNLLPIIRLSCYRTISAGSSSSGQQTANYLITVYGAFGLPSGSLSQGDRRYVKQPSTYVKVSFCGLSVKQFK